MRKNNVLIPLNYDIQKPDDLFPSVIRDFFISINQIRNYYMLKQYYGFGGEEKHILEDIGIVNSVSRQRVDQILKKSRTQIETLFSKGEFEDQRHVIKLFPDIAALFQTYIKQLNSQSVFSQNELFETTRKHFDISNIDMHTIHFILHLFNFSLVDTGSSDAKAWISSVIESDRIEAALKSVFEYLRDECLDKSTEEILLGINRSLIKNKRFSREELEQALRLHDDIERLETGRYQVKLMMLRRDEDKLFRLLYENNKRMHIRDIIRIFNKSISHSGRSTSQKHLSNRMVG